MAEFSIINRYFSGIGVTHPQTQLSVGDDAAVLNVAESQQLVISVDTMVSGVHFFPDVDAQTLGHKLLAVNLSDLAAMGATPKWATLSLTLPEINHHWLEKFSRGLDALATKVGIELVGGDTTQGPLCLSLQVMGLVPQGQALKRSGAKSGEDLWLSGTVGDAALALQLLQKNRDFETALTSPLRASLEQPKPQIELGQQLLGVASACMDVSDGLVGDLKHMTQASKVCVEIDLQKIPISENLNQASISQDQRLELALNGGDDYQLVFTAPILQREKIAQIAEEVGSRLSRIGRVVESHDSLYNVRLLSAGQPVSFKETISYEHFTR